MSVEFVKLLIIHAADCDIVAIEKYREKPDPTILEWRSVQTKGPGEGRFAFLLTCLWFFICGVFCCFRILNSNDQ